MAGRHHRMPPSNPRRNPPVPVHVLRQRVIAQKRDIELLFLDNQRLANAHVALKRDLAASEQHVRHLSATAASIKEDRDAQVHQVYEKCCKLEAEARSINGLAAAVEQVRANSGGARTERKEWAEKLRDVEDDLANVRLELKQMAEIEAKIELVNKEIKRGRAAIEYERKVHRSNLEQSEAMEKLMKSMAQEIEKLHPELANAEKLAMAAAAPVPTAQSYTSLETGYSGSLSSGSYGQHQVLAGATSFQYNPLPLPYAGPVPVPAPYAGPVHMQVPLPHTHPVPVPHAGPLPVVPHAVPVPVPYAGPIALPHGPPALYGMQLQQQQHR